MKKKDIYKTVFILTIFFLVFISYQFFGIEHTIILMFALIYGEMALSNIDKKGFE